MAIDWDKLVLGPAMGLFGEEISYIRRGASPVTIYDAVFDEESADIAIGEDAQVSTQRKPACGVRAAALPGGIASQDDTVIRLKNGIAYLVKDPVPDGHGHIHLTLMSKSGS